MSYRWSVVTSLYVYLSAICFLVQPLLGLHCYECSDTFTTIWLPQTCQLNATGAPIRECNDQQTFCYVQKITVVNRVISITRDCTDTCNYGCQMASFGITQLTCTTCCTDDVCNTGDGEEPIRAHPLTLSIAMFLVALLIFC